MGNGYHLSLTEPSLTILNISQVNVAVVPKVPMVVAHEVAVPKVPMVVDPMVVAQVVVPKPPMELAQDVDRHNKDRMQPLLRQ